MSSAAAGVHNAAVRRTVLVAADVDRSFFDRADADGRFEVVHRVAGTEEELAASVADAHVLVTRAHNRVTRRVIGAAPRLELIAQATAGIDNIDAHAAAERGIRIVHMPGINANAVAEWVIGAMISLTRTIPFYTRQLAAGTFDRNDCATRHELGHHRLGIVGLGHVGSRVARLAAAFGVSSRAYDPYIDDFAARGASRTETLRDLLASSDVVTLHVPLTTETRGMIGAAEIAALPRGSYLINASRGEVLDQRAALEALASGHLAGLALDVFDHEPPSAPLGDDPRLIVTPHIAGCSHEVKSGAGARLYDRIIEAYATR